MTSIPARLRDLSFRNELFALAAIAIAVPLLPKNLPAGIAAIGLVGGASLSIQAIGIILVYRSNRFINFAQPMIGLVAASLFATSVEYRPLLRWTERVCPSCVDPVTPTLIRVNFFVSVVLALAFAVLVGWAVHAVVIRRFADAPRLVLTVASVFVGRALLMLPQIFFRNLTTADQREQARLASGAAAPIPFDLEVKVGSATLHLPELLTLLVAVLCIVGVTLYFNRSAAGTAIRAAAENSARAETLGMNVHAIAGRVWGLVGGLAGLAAMLSATTGRIAPTFGASTLVRILAVTVIARMVSLPMAAAGAVVLGVLEQAMQWAFGTIVFFDGSLVFIVGGLLLVQRGGMSRAEIEQSSAWRAARELRPIPPELRGLPSVRKWVRIGIGVGTAAVLAYPWLMSQAQTAQGTTYMVTAMLGMSLLVLTGWAGQISLGQFAFAAVGAFVAAASGLPFLLALPAGAVVGAVVAVVVGLPALRLQGLHLAISTLAFALSSTALLLSPRTLGRHLPGTLHRPTILGVRLDDERTFYYVTVGVLLLVILGVLGMRRSRTCRALVAARDNTQAAQSFGVNVVRARLSAFAVSGFIAALAGGLFAFAQGGVKAESFSPDQSIDLFLTTVIGGLGGIAGPILGVAFLAGQQLVGRSELLAPLISGAGGLLLVMLVPGGLAQALWDARDALLRRVAKRNHILVPSLIADQRPGAVVDTVPIAPRQRPGGGTVFVPTRYGLEGQWVIAHRRAERAVSGD
jgi:branched-chain amino acid transport system permease protein